MSETVSLARSSDVDEKEAYKYDRRERKLDPGVNIVRKRRHWFQLWLPKHDAPPPPATLAEADEIPLATASWLSVLAFSWITPILDLGYARTLQATDLYALDESRASEPLRDALDAAWNRRAQKAKEFNDRLARGEIKPSCSRKAIWWIKRRCISTRIREEQEEKWREGKRKRASLAWSLNDVIGRRFWIAGVYKVFGDTAQLMSPILVRTIITFAERRFAAHNGSGNPQPLVEGVFMAIGLFLLSNIQNFGQQHFFWRAMSAGVLARGALIASVYSRGVHLTPATRSEGGYDNSKLLHYVSGDISRIDAASQWFHAAWTAPIQVTICLIILLAQLGPTALIGFSLFVLLIPFQDFLMKRQYRARKVASEWSDRRMSLLSECFSGMKVVKWFCYEEKFLERISGIRRKELNGVWNIEVNGSVNIAVAFSVPILAAVVSFTAYLLTSNDFNVAIIFSSLTLFNLLRQPLMFLPRAMSSIADARSAFDRLTPLFEAELADTSTLLDIDSNLKEAILVEGASFTWHQSSVERERHLKGDGKKKASKRSSRIKEKEKEKEKGEIDARAPSTEATPFKLRNISLRVQRGSVVAIVGPVGSGKSSLVQGLIGEMTRVDTNGTVKFGGPIAYCSQVAWIQNASLRENVLFGLPWDAERYWSAVGQACLIPDLDVLPQGDLTEIGEKGINLSGGQKQRINIARALYCDANVVIMDDPLSAVDAHVGKTLFHSAIMGQLRGRGKAVLLVTHALHFVSEVDYIYTVQNGAIEEEGSYAELMAKRAGLYRLLQEHGGTKKEPEEKGEERDGKIVDLPQNEEYVRKKVKGGAAGKAAGKEDGGTTKEARRTGSVSWKVYGTYAEAGRGWLMGPIIVLCAIIMQTSQILNTYVLVWWQADSFHLAQTTYAGMYASFGVAQGIFAFFLGISMAGMARIASHELHQRSVDHIFHAPSSFFDLTPLGRLIGVFGKDFDSIDNSLTNAIRLLAITLSLSLGAIVVVVILEHFFLIAIFFLGIIYFYFAEFYGASSRELKRLDAMMRSLLYGHFAESLTGLPTLKAYNAVPLFVSDNAYYIDLENRALLLTTTTQRWLSVRLGFLGSLMTFIVAMFAVMGVSGISPAEIGLILTYTTQLTQMLTVVTRQTTDVENYMNAVERVVEYSRGQVTPQEAPHQIPERTPKEAWPSLGSITWQDVEMSYRPGLPTVLKGLNFDIGGGEKVGVVGRTGAGKSSLVMALFRITELTRGRIIIDGVDISKLGLYDLRSKLSIIPQEPLLFSGTIRSNLDPFSIYDDARLWDALRRACLVDLHDRKFHEPQSSQGHSFDESDKRPLLQVSRFTLESIVEAEGLNLSVGERSLLSLARALVKDSRIVILDEATASVDLDTDGMIQKTIQTEFSDKTLICIAHRLRTILSYDRILVMDGGEVAEFDTPINLFDLETGIFRSMCNRSGISRADIEKAKLSLQG